MKLAPGRASAIEGKEEYSPRLLVSNLFHQLSQPLTSLSCSLELALVQAPTAEEYSQIVRHARGQAEKVSWLVTAIREIHNASEAGENPEIVDLPLAVEDLIADLLPVAESAGVQLWSLPGPPGSVRFDPLRLRQALFHLLGSVVSTAGQGAVVKVVVERLAEDMALMLTVSGGGGIAQRAASGEEYPPQELVQRLGMGIACAVFEAAGGRVRVEQAVEGMCLEVRLVREEVR